MAHPNTCLVRKRARRRQGASKRVVLYFKGKRPSIPICPIHAKVGAVSQKDYHCMLEEDVVVDESNVYHARRDGPCGHNVAASLLCANDLVGENWTIGNQETVCHSFAESIAFLPVGVRVFVDAESRIGDLRGKRAHPWLRGEYEMDQC